MLHLLTWFLGISGWHRRMLQLPLQRTHTVLKLQCRSPAWIHLRAGLCSDAVCFLIYLCLMTCIGLRSWAYCKRKKPSSESWLLVTAWMSLDCRCARYTLIHGKYKKKSSKLTSQWSTMFDYPHQTIKLLTWPMEASSCDICGTITSHRPRIASLRSI